MKRIFIFLLLAGFILAAAHRVPAPIVPPESPTPAPEQSTRPKKSAKSKPKTEHSGSPASAASQQPSAKQSRFAGSWVGNMQTFPAGNQTTVLAVDPTETTMTVTWFGKRDTAKAQLDADTIRATFPPPPFQPQPHKWSLTPQPDGVTAHVRFQCFLNDFTAVFRRSGAESAAAKPRR